MVSFSPETVQEFTVQTTAYSAEYGTTGGGIISATTKSGSNQFAGTALWYNRNPAAAASPFTQAAANRPQPTLKSNQFSLAAAARSTFPNSITVRTRPSGSPLSSRTTGATIWISTDCCPPRACATAISAAW
jgi:hypothetical protein